jgi:pyruvate-formate lyase-activating enzyme
MSKKPRPALLFADENGDIYDHPELEMLVRRGNELARPRPDEYIPLPDESELFLLPGRRAVGLDPESGEIEVLDEQAVAAFVRPGFTLTGAAAYASDEGAPVLPLLAYAPVGFANGKIWAACKQVDDDTRQVFSGIDPERIRRGARDWMAEFPDNRLVAHLARCALTYCCPAARNLALGRYEAPLPTARGCNAACLGCISLQAEDSGFPAPQNRIDFLPTPDEIVQVMHRHASSEKRPIMSFGQGCEGEPLTEWRTIAAAVKKFRSEGGKGTVNVNTNAGMPGAVAELAVAGVSSIRVSLNSVRPDFYEAYYKPRGYGFPDVVESIRAAKAGGMFVSLNYLFFPGVSDTEEEVEALGGLVSDTGVDFIQLRNMNIDPEVYMALAGPHISGPSMGLANFKKRVKRAAPDIEFGYFNPYLGQ